jgi:hypothetical protein
MDEPRCDVAPEHCGMVPTSIPDEAFPQDRAGAPEYFRVSNGSAHLSTTAFLSGDVKGIKNF